MRTLIASLLFAAAVAVAVRAQDSRPVASSPASQGAHEAAASRPASAPANRFGYADVFVDSGAKPLAAYQLELKATHAGIRIVGIEGGAHAAFSEPPYYDPEAMSHERVILAAFSTARDLPAGRTRVARVHLMIPAEAPVSFDTKLNVAAGPAGEAISATIAVMQGDAR